MWPKKKDITYTYTNRHLSCCFVIMVGTLCHRWVKSWGFILVRVRCARFPSAVEVYWYAEGRAILAVVPMWPKKKDALTVACWFPVFSPSFLQLLITLYSILLPRFFLRCKNENWIRQMAKCTEVTCSGLCGVPDDSPLVLPAQHLSSRIDVTKTWYKGFVEWPI